jgi:uncharacterized membrane protein (DUF4010 family)
MDIIFIGVLILVAIIVTELFKHLVTKTALKFVVLVIIGIIIFLAVVGSLSSENVIETDNEYVKTGAAVADSFNEAPLIIKAKEKLQDLSTKLQEEYLE